MAERITVTLDTTEKYLDKQRDIADAWGVKWSVDSFKVKSIKGRTATVTFIKLTNPTWNGSRTIYNHLPIMTKQKRIKIENDEVLISICGIDYCIGTVLKKH